MIGRTLSHYKILQKLGSGGMGEDLSSDDCTIYFNRRRSEADIWMVTLDVKPQ